MRVVDAAIADFGMAAMWQFGVMKCFFREKFVPLDLGQSSVCFVGVL
jgi:hypothetical protein